jgi:hypothetical protein
MEMILDVSDMHRHSVALKYPGARQISLYCSLHTAVSRLELPDLWELPVTDIEHRCVREPTPFFRPPKCQASADR